MNIFGYIAVAALVLHFLGALAVVIISRRRPGRVRGPGYFPKISILKPLKGIDDGLRDNLESFFNIDYPDYEMVFGASEENDPAVSIARSLKEKHPERRAKISIGSSTSGANPKVGNLIRMIKHCAGEIIVISDSNTRVRPNYLAESIHFFDDPDVAIVSHFLSGEGEKTAGAVLEHLHICGFIAPAQAFATVYGRITPVIGKSMMIRRSHLEEVGGLEGLADYLAEDYLLGRKLAAAGKKVILSPGRVTNYNSFTSLRVFILRHYRWLSMRWRINPVSCLLELLTVPFLWNFLWFVSGACSPLYPAAVYAANLLVQQFVVTFIREGRPLPPESVALSPVKDMLHAFILLAGLPGKRVEWRGNYYKIGWKTRLTPIDAPPARVPNPSIFAARLGDPWPLREGPHLGYKPVTLI